MKIRPLALVAAVALLVPALASTEPSASDPFDPGSSLDSSCTAWCGNGGSVSVTCSGTCTAVDQVCDSGGSSSGGYVTCNGATTSSCGSCPPPPPLCPEYHGKVCKLEGSIVICDPGFCNCVGGIWECVGL